MELALCDGGMTRKSYITSSITAVIFATVVFPSFSLCVPSTCRHLCCVLKWLAEILPSPRMAAAAERSRKSESANCLQ